jgi:hypothetical protein
MLNTKCDVKGGWQIFSGAPQMISAGGILSSNQQVTTTGTETAVATETVYGKTLNTVGQTFKVTLVGEISSEGSGDCTFTLRYGTTDILAVASAGLADEDDKPFKLEFIGRIHTAGATGKVVCTGILYVYQGTPITIMADTANTGATVNLTADGSLNVTADWDVSSSDCDVIVTSALMEFFD